MPMGQTDSVEWFVGRGWGVSWVLRLAGIPSQTAELTGILLSLHLSQLPASVYDILGCRRARFGVCTCLSVCPNGRTMLVASCTRSHREKKINCWTRRPLTEKSGKRLLVEKKWGKDCWRKESGKKSCWRKESGENPVDGKKVGKDCWWKRSGKMLYAFQGKEIKEDYWRKRSGKRLLTEKKRGKTWRKDGNGKGFWWKRSGRRLLTEKKWGKDLTEKK